MDAHFQIGINQAYVFVWLSVIDQPKNQATIAESWLAQKELFDQLPADFTLSPDHTKYDHHPIAMWPTYLERFKKVKKSELQIGKIFPKEMIEDVEMVIPSIRIGKKKPLLKKPSLPLSTLWPIRSTVTCLPSCLKTV